MYKFVLPNGNESKIIRFDLINEYNNKILLDHELSVKDGVYTLPKNFGVVWINVGETQTSLQWNITKKSDMGSIYKLKWYTETV